MISNNMFFVDLFEKKLANYTGFKYAITTDCCTNAILLAIKCREIVDNILYKNLEFTSYTYMSVPMTLKNNGYSIKLNNTMKWNKSYLLYYNNSKTIVLSNIFDAATDFKEHLKDDYDNNALVCVSFLQKKRLSLGRGGAILFNNKRYYDILKRLSYDGRDRYKSDKDEIICKHNSIICGYHCYMEPDKAVKGILILNLPILLKPYKQYSYNDYIDLLTLNIW